MNTALLLKVRDRILAEPEHFVMRSFVEDTDCGTACCIAGWAVALSHPDGAKALHAMCAEEIQDRAEILLGVSEDLFFTSHWPDEFMRAYYFASARGDITARARAAADYINHFIATEGRE